jgi:transglutaminase-like putative cysteine protease/preprotein translocase subunit SecG
LLAGAVLGVVLESARWLAIRWDLGDQDFRRIWTFCTLLALVLAVYVFTTNEEGGGLGGLMQGGAAAHNASITTAQTANMVLRCLPLTLFLFIAAQQFSERGSVPLSTMSLLISWRRRRRGSAGFVERQVDVSYPYFITVIFSAGVHPNPGTHAYFFGLAVLTAWALWPLRSRRPGAFGWFGALVLVLGIGFFGQLSLYQLQRLLEGYNAQWLARFMRPKTDASQSVTAIGQIGNLKLSPRIVIRLQPKTGLAPAYLREASYRNYHPFKQTWYASGSRNGFTEILPEANSGDSSWVLVPGKTNASDVSIAAYLDGWSQELSVPEGLLPLPTGSRRLENLPAVSLETNKTGAALAAGLGLVIFDAHFAPGATFDAPPDLNLKTNFDLSVPTNEIPALEQVIAEMNISGTNDLDKRLAVERFFSANFTYSLWQGPDKATRTNATPLTRFLLTSRSGHCEYFATATVLLLRELKIPARYAVGYFVHETSGSGYVVRERDAHAWCLMWDAKNKAWQDFDTTPAAWVAAENSRASFMERFSDSWSWVTFQFAKLRWGQMPLRPYILWALIPAMTVLLYHIIFRRGRKRQRPPRGKKSGAPVIWPGLDSEFYRLENKLAARSYPRPASEPISGWLERALREPSLAGLRAPLQELLRLHYRLRFDPDGLAVDERKALAQKAEAILQTLLQK